jgi:arylsulfatase A-like enzyme
VLGLIASILIDCGAPPGANLLIVTIDTLRPDRMSAYGYERDTSPRLAAFAAEGVRFALAYAPMSATLPSHTTLFTGQYPITHGVVKNGTPLPGENETLAEMLRGRGYQTAAFVSSFVLDRRFGLEQGFDRYDDDFSGADPSMGIPRWEGHEVEIFDRRAEHTTRHAVGWLEAQAAREAPFFLFVHYFDPHAPYAPPGEAALRFHEAGVGHKTGQKNLYDAEIAYVDAHVGALLDAMDRLALAERTLVLITSDHGEGLWDHDAQMHGVHVYEEQVRIPLLVRWPGRIAPGRVIEVPVGLVDVTPTVLDLLGIGKGSRHFAARSLAPALERGAALPPRVIYSHREPYLPGEVDGVHVAGELFAVRQGRWKYIEGPLQGNRELYDLERDPQEREDRYYAEPVIGRRLRQRVSDWREAHAGPELRRSLADEDREALEALGYVE